MPISLMKQPNSQYNVRSISFPARSHPTALKIEEQINKLRSLHTLSSSNLTSALSGLSELYNSMADLLGLPLTQQALSQHQHEKWVNELLNSTLQYLDICGNTRDSVLLMKKSSRELQSALRRSMAGELNIEKTLRDYNCSRKFMKKELSKHLTLLKMMENGFGEFRVPLSEQSHHLSRVLRDCNLTTVLTIRSLLIFLAPTLSSKQKGKGTKKWLLISKLVKKGGVLLEEGNNEVQSAKIAVRELGGLGEDVVVEAEKVEFVLEKLEALDGVLGDFENGLEFLFRCLIHCRVSLLNIVSS